MDPETDELLQKLSSREVQQYILEHEHEDERIIALKNRPIVGLPAKLIANQILCRRKARSKLPTYYNTNGIIFPESRQLEQTSSEITAKLKVSLLRKHLPPNPRIADLTGGFGVDSYFLSLIASHLHFVEVDEALIKFAAHSHKRLGASNISYHHCTAENFLATEFKTDLIYVDPSRRPRGQKVFLLEDGSPNVIELFENIFTKTSLLLVKSSPMLDIRAGLRALNFVKNVFVVSMDNECKELLFLCDKTSRDQPGIETFNITKDDMQSFVFKLTDEQNASANFSDPQSYLYEPNASILKAGAFKSIAQRHGLFKIAADTHLYTSDSLLETFPGKTFEIIGLMKPEKSEAMKHFPQKQANVVVRNYPLTPEQIKKRTGLSDGGEKFLFGFSGEKKKFLAIAKRVR